MSYCLIKQLVATCRCHKAFLKKYISYGLDFVENLFKMALTFIALIIGFNSVNSPLHDQ